jgi:uncharacterized protein YcbK (DUF882 family)
VTVKVAHKNPLTLRSVRAAYCCSIAAILVVIGTQNAAAASETRTISFHHIHSKEDLTVTYKRNGRYDEEALKQINHLLRDWRDQNAVKMDPQLIDLLWEVHREVGAKEPIWVVGGHRSPDTNEMLRRRSSGVAKFSQHVNGKAIDFHIPGVALEDIRAAGLRSERGGVGIYPSSGFVHMDTGSVRHWPRMPEEQLARVMAKGQLGSRFASDDGSVRRVATASAAPSRKPAFLAKLFGGGKDEEEHEETTAAAAPTKVAAKPADKAAPVPPAKPAKSDTVQAPPAAAKPAAKPATFQLASATSKTVAVVVTPDSDEAAPAPAKPAVAPATFEVASATSKPVRPAQATSLVARANMSSTDVINDRGNWQGPPSAEPAGAPRRPAAVTVASADPATTASVAPWPLADRKDNEPLPNALAYAAQPTPIAAARTLPMGSGTPRAAPAGETTVAVKRGDDRPAAAAPAAAVPVKPKGTNLVRIGDRFNDPWMRAMIVSPSAQSFMHTTLFGAPDFRDLGPHMHKPAASVMMTFSEDPHLGVISEKFSGSAVVFVSTVTFRGAARTASLK